jgi:hypothetical protein
MSTVQSQFSFARVTSAINAAIAAKQDTLVSGTNIRSINGNSLLGSGDLAISASTAPLVLGTNLVQQRNGTNGQRAQWFKTYTSDTNFEAVEIDAAGNASNFDIAACIGSAGGVARGIRIGGKNAAGTFTPWLVADTSGNWILGATAPTTFSATGRLALSALGNRGIQIEGNTGSLGVHCNFSGVARSGANAAFSFDGTVGGVIPLLIGRSSSAVTFTELDGLGNLTFTPQASRTLATNGQFTIERVSDTSINLVYRGNDGTTRRSALTFT